MRTKRGFLSILLIGAFVALASCEKLELPVEDNETEEQPSTPEEPVTPSGGDTITVGEARQLASGTVCVKGYIVGYVTGASFNGAILGLPSQANTSMLLADRPDESDTKQCLPVRLEADSYRPLLNLYDHPDYYRRLICVSGNIEAYYGMAGIRTIDAYDWPATDEESGGDIPPDIGVNLPTLDPNQQHVDGGRNVCVKNK